MNMKKLLVLSAVTLMVGSFMPESACAQQPYVGVGLGMFSMDPGGNSNSALGAYLQAGEDFAPYLGGEVRIGTTDRASNNAKMNWFVGAYLKPKYDFSSDLSIYALLGITLARTSYISDRTGYFQQKTKADVSYGLGFDYWAGAQYTVGAEWVRYQSQADSVTKNTNFGGLNIDSFIVDAKYHF